MNVEQLREALAGFSGRIEVYIERDREQFAELLDVSDQWIGLDVVVVLQGVVDEDETKAALRRANVSLLAMLERMETQHVTFSSPDGEPIHPEWCRECRLERAAARGFEHRLRDILGFIDGGEVTADGSMHNDMVADNAEKVLGLIRELGGTLPRGTLDGAE